MLSGRWGVFIDKLIVFLRPKNDRKYPTRTLTFSPWRLITAGVGPLVTLGWGPFISKGPGYPSEILKRTSLRYQDPVLWVWLEFFFSLLRGMRTNSKEVLTSYFFRLNTLKGTKKAPTVDALTMNTLGSITPLFNPLKVDELTRLGYTFEAQRKRHRHLKDTDCGRDSRLTDPKC